MVYKNVIESLIYELPQVKSLCNFNISTLKWYIHAKHIYSKTTSNIF